MVSENFHRLTVAQRTGKLFNDAGVRLRQAESIQPAGFQTNLLI